MNMMEWMKQTILVQYLRPVAVSSLQHSHTDVVYELRFLHPCWTVSRKYSLPLFIYVANQKLRL